MIRQAVSDDLNDIVTVHLKAFRDFLMTRLGRRFLRAYYTVALSYPDVIALVSSDNSGVVNGFAIGYCNPSAFYTFFDERKREIVFPVLLSLLRNPFLLPRVIASKRKADSSAGDAEYGEGNVELASIAVLPESGGKGIGRQLLRSFIRTSADRKASAVYLTTDEENNDATISFYEKNGFLLEKTLITSSHRKTFQAMTELWY
jgi:ribosomal protein S18 acetylase RimI-like enzyme